MGDTKRAGGSACLVVRKMIIAGNRRLLARDVSNKDEVVTWRGGKGYEPRTRLPVCRISCTLGHSTTFATEKLSAKSNLWPEASLEDANMTEAML
jgi:hypothetical protein